MENSWWTTGWPFRLWHFSRWHQNKSYVLVRGAYTKTRHLFWCQREVCHNLNGHPVCVGAAWVRTERRSRSHGWCVSDEDDEGSGGRQKKCGIWPFYLYSVWTRVRHCFWPHSCGRCPGDLDCNANRSYPMPAHDHPKYFLCNVSLFSFSSCNQGSKSRPLMRGLWCSNGWLIGKSCVVSLRLSL